MKLGRTVDMSKVVAADAWMTCAPQAFDRRASTCPRWFLGTQERDVIKNREARPL